jgi:8-oxo-dGTP pyrophosphatase MutT (NUDIX family)
MHTENIDNLKHVVTAILKYQKKILILKRSPKSKSMQDKWGCISGYLEPNEDQLTRALTEILEETGIESEQLILQKIPPPIQVEFEDRVTFIIQPFCFSSKLDRVNLNWENVEFRWIGVADIKLFDLVPRLDELINCCFK